MSIRKRVIAGAIAGMAVVGLAMPGVASADQLVGSHWVKGKIETAYFATQGPARWGVPITDELNDRRGGKFQKFKNDTSFYWHPFATGGDAQQVGGAIFPKWGSLGWETGVLGYPTSDEKHREDRFRRVTAAWNTFQGGTIVWTPRFGTYTVWGLIKTEHDKNGGVLGKYGAPRGPEIRTADGWYQDFENGRITV